MTLYLYVHPYQPVFQAQVNRTVAPTYPVSLIAYDNLQSGSEAAVREGMTLLLGTTLGDEDLGRARVRKVDSLGREVQIGSASQGYHDGEVTIVDNTFITIVNDYRVWAKVPFIDDDTPTILKDGVDLPVGNIDRPTPVANAGPAMAGTIGAGGKLRVTFDGSESFAFTPGDAHVVLVDTYAWDIVDGTIVTGTVSSSTLTVDFPAGFRYVRLTVTNTAYGKSHTAVVPVFARDPANDATLSFQVLSHEMAQSGQTMSVGIFESLDAISYRDGSLALIWEDEPDGPADRTHMRFTGWHQTDESRTQHARTGTTYDTVLNLVDAAGRLATLPGFAQRIERVSSAPQTWTQSDHNTILWYIYYLLYWHSSVLDVTDFILGSHMLDTFFFVTLASERGNLLEQAQSLVRNVTPDHLLLSNMAGQIVLSVDPLILPQSLRASMVIVGGTIYDSYYEQITINRQRPPRVGNIDAGAILSTSDYVLVDGEPTIPTVFCKAPGRSVGQGMQTISGEPHITPSQATLNLCEGNRYARVNSPYGPLTVTMPFEKKDYQIEPGYAGWTVLYMSNKQAWRGFFPPVPVTGTDYAGALAGTSILCLCKAVSVSYDYSRTGLTRTATITLEVETAGPPALTYTPPPPPRVLRTATLTRTLAAATLAAGGTHT